MIVNELCVGDFFKPPCLIYQVYHMFFVVRNSILCYLYHIFYVSHSYAYRENIVNLLLSHSRVYRENLLVMYV